MTSLNILRNQLWENVINSKYGEDEFKIYRTFMDQPNMKVLLRREKQKEWEHNNKEERNKKAREKYARDKIKAVAQSV